MLLSQKWLQEFVELDVTPREFANTMAMTGFCIGGYEREGDEIKDVVVGRLLKVERHPTVEKYFVCQVDVGGHQPGGGGALPRLPAGRARQGRRAHRGGRV